MEGFRKLAKVFIGSAALALISTIVIGALALYGIIDIAAARTLLFIAWVIAVLGTLVSDYLCEKSWKHILGLTVLVAVVAGAGVFALDRYAVNRKREQATASAPPPSMIHSGAPSTKELAEEIAKQLPKPSHDKEIVEQHTVKAEAKARKSVGASASAPTPPKPSQDNSVHFGAGSQVDQRSTGPCSPNIIGGSNTVNCIPQQRRIPEDKLPSLISCLKKKLGIVQISALSGDGDAFTYAHDWEGAFMSAGWKQDGPINSFGIGRGIWYGVTLVQIRF